MAQRYVVTLTDEARAPLLALTKRGKVSARRLTRAHRWLQTAAGVSDEAIAQALHIGTATVARIRQRCVEEGLEAALTEPPRPGGQRQLDGKPAACLIALACRTAPKGRTCWRMQWLADKRVALHVVESSSDETVRRPLKNTSSSRGSRRRGVFPA